MLMLSECTLERMKGESWDVICVTNDSCQSSLRHDVPKQQFSFEGLPSWTNMTLTDSAECVMNIQVGEDPSASALRRGMNRQNWGISNRIWLKSFMDILLRDGKSSIWATSSSRYSLAP